MPRGRSEEADRRIEAAALSLLREGGPRAVTVEAVAATSGVAKTTIYRRHADRSALLRSALAAAIGEPGPPPEGPVRDKIEWAIEQVWQQMAEVLGRGGLAAVVGDEDPDFTAVFRSVLAPYDAALVAEVDADIEAGLLRPGLDAEAVVSLLVGAHLGELVRHGRVGPDWARRCLDVMWAAMTENG